MRLSLLAPIALLAAVSFPVHAEEQAAGTIAITGKGEVMAAPDTALITSGVTTQGATARAALDANTAAMSELIRVLKDAGIAASDIQTSGFSVNPNYVYSDARDENGYPRPPRIDGYQVFNTVTVRVRDLDILGTVLDRAVTVGANTINGISFSVADPTELFDAARRKAFTDARRKAELYAGAAERTLGKVHTIAEEQRHEPPQPYMAAAAFDRAESAPVPVEGGELSFTATVSVTWELDEN